MCTNLSIKSEYDPVISARTLDFVEEMPTEVVFVPRRQHFPLLNFPDEMRWENKYAFIGLKSTLPGTNLAGYSDGLNEKGLSAASLWLQCSKYPEKIPDKPFLYSMDVVSYVLSNFGNVGEIEEKFNEIQIIDITGLHPKAFAPMHFIFSDDLGNHLIIEFMEGKMRCYKNRDGILTNEPAFDWHLINLQNYENLSLKNNPDQICWGDELYGSGQLGSPGDPSSPSRFIRSELLSRSTFKPKNVQQSIGLAVQVLNTIAVPCGTVNMVRKEGYDWTQWSVIRDHTNRSLYFYSAFNPRLFGVHLKDLDPESGEQKCVDIIQPGWYKDITCELK
jgi:choloylglycine hydrolase